MRPLGPFGAARHVVVAVSGGADSMALALLLRRWGRPVAAIVDHGLRPESAAEAAATAARLEAIGVSSSIGCAGLAAGSATAERARTARYALLVAACRRAGVPDLLLAHHAGDQAETVWMRREAGSGPLGLGGMAPLSYRNEVRLLRPLLGIDPSRLRATLRREGIGWAEDPSNTDLRTARGRLRATLKPSERVATLAAAAAGRAERDCRAATAAAELAAVRLAPEGFAVVSGPPLGPDALSALLWTVSGRAYPPPRSALARGLAPRTIHGVLLRPAGRLGGGTLVTREPDAVAADVPAADGAVWDGRFRLRGTVAAGLSLGALGADSARMRTRSGLPATVLSTLPALRREGVIVAVPHLAFPDAAACRSVSVDFWPRRPVAPGVEGGSGVNLSTGRGV